MNQVIVVEERDGMDRRVYPCTAVLELPEGGLRPSDPVRLMDEDGAELPVQLDAVGSWKDGSVRTAHVTFCPTIDAFGTQGFTLECGGQSAEACVRNPLTISVRKDAAEVRQGPVSYFVRRHQFNLVDGVVFGDKSFLRPGARGVVLRTKDGTECRPDGDIELRACPIGPWWGRLRVEGGFECGYGFECILDFVSGKSWYLADIRLQAGDLAQVESVIFEQAFDLPAAPLSTAFGSMTTSEEVAANWSITTDGVNTVDVAALDAWSNSGSVRHEVDPDGSFRLIFPYAEGATFRAWYHYLGTPPDDTRNTSAAAMAARLICTPE